MTRFHDGHIRERRAEFTLCHAMWRVVEDDMRKSLAKLLFAISLLVIGGPFQGRLVRANVDNWCSCDGFVYLYYTHPQYGPWLYIDQYEHEVGGPLSSPGPAGAVACADACVDNGAANAQFALCDLYSETEYPGQHYSVAGYYNFDDFDDQYGGDGQGGYNTGSTHGALYCPS